jgi:hypothetical protein
MEKSFHFQSCAYPGSLRSFDCTRSVCSQRQPKDKKDAMAAALVQYRLVLGIVDPAPYLSLIIPQPPERWFDD